jgi:DNA invertase Pin-like site-specific DNA recombinase
LQISLEVNLTLQGRRHDRTANWIQASFDGRSEHYAPLDGVAVDEVFEDKASGKSTAQRPALEAMLKHVRKGDVVLCHSMDRMARNLDDLRRIVLGLTSRGVRVELPKRG